MVATRRGAKTALEEAPAPSNILNAPPKRGGKKKADIEGDTEAAPVATKATKRKAKAELEADAPPMVKKAAVKKAAEPVPAASKTTKRKAKSEPEADAPPMAKKAAVKKATKPVSAATKRKAQAEPEADAPPMAKKMSVTAKIARDAKAEMPAALKRATRGRKAEETVAEEEPAPAVVNRAIKPATTRARKIPAKKAAIVEEPVAVGEDVVEEVPKPASRTRRAPAKKAAVIEEAELVKPAARTRKAAAPKLTAPTPVLAPGVTHEGHVVALEQDSPLKAPARKPTKKAAAPAPVPFIPAIPEVEQIEEPFTEFPGVSSTPGRFAQDFTTRRAMRELPNYPSTPAHISAPISSKAAMAELPGYPQTPAHIQAPMSTKAALAEMPSYPNTPAHIKVPSPALEVMDEIHEESETSIQDDGAMEGNDEHAVDTSNEAAMNELPDYPTTPAHIAAPLSSKDALEALPDYPMTPAHIRAPLANKDALDELPGYPKTPAHVQVPQVSSEAPVELADDSHTPIKNTPSPTAAVTQELAIAESTTPIGITSPVQQVMIENSTTPEKMASTPKAGNVPATAVGDPSTPTEISSPITEGNFLSGTPRVPENITWGITDQEAFEELPEDYPTTPDHIKAPVSIKDTLAELPGYPKTPAHIIAPMTPRRALAELPNYPTTPAMAMEAAIQEEISASVKKQTPSPLAKKQTPLAFPQREDNSFSIAHDDSEMTDVSNMDSEIPETMSKFSIAPLQLAAVPTLAPPTQLATTLSAQEPASPIKSALRSPQKMNFKTPKKAVTWDDPEENGVSLLNEGPLGGMTFLVDVTRKGKDQEFLFRHLLEDLGAKVVQDWESGTISHVIYKDGNNSTLQKIVASNGAIKCVNVGYALDCEAQRRRLDENPYLVDLSITIPDPPKPVAAMRTYTPMRTPSQNKVATPSVCTSLPATPTSSELDRSMVIDDDKENSEIGLFFRLDDDFREIRSVPPKKSRYLFARSPIKTPSQPKFLAQTPIKPQSVMQPATVAGKKRSMEESFPSILSASPKKLRFT
ncbi:hypothetical protein IAQ61_009518 [Plenodomus lingam]|uniref:uncharacterized protein n=1 Tax=Leptosphaeria maculans TaxID=5022 RepID=UPI00332F6977|nr:hypothetical protein IAQ61_009518 [Plenodomus lingam]